MIKLGKFTTVPLSGIIQYWNMTKDDIKKKYNGIGPENFWLNLIPRIFRNSVWLSDFGEIGYIHDCGYDKKPENISDEELMKYKYERDIELRNNGNIIADYYYMHPGWFASHFVSLKWLRKQRKERIQYYYELCRDHGEEYFITGDKRKLPNKKP